MKWTTTHTLTVINIAVVLFGIFYNGKMTIEIKEVRNEIQTNRAKINNLEAEIANIKKIFSDEITAREFKTTGCPDGQTGGLWFNNNGNPSIGCAQKPKQ